MSQSVEGEPGAPGGPQGGSVIEITDWSSNGKVSFKTPEGEWLIYYGTTDNYQGINKGWCINIIPYGYPKTQSGTIGRRVEFTLQSLKIIINDGNYRTTTEIDQSGHTFHCKDNSQMYGPCWSGGQIACLPFQSYAGSGWPKVTLTGFRVTKVEY